MTDEWMMSRALAPVRTALATTAAPLVEFALLWDAKPQTVFATRDSRSFKFTYPHPTGPRNCDVCLLVERNARGGATYVAAMARDYTVPRPVLRAHRGADALQMLASQGIEPAAVIFQHDAGKPLDHT